MAGTYTDAWHVVSAGLWLVLLVWQPLRPGRAE